jgi:hypothetical protein
LLGVVLAAGCVGEASVSYQGSVIEGPFSMSAFEDAPAVGTPIEGALVELCIAPDCSRSTSTDASGLFREMDLVFGGSVGDDTTIEVRVTAPDGRAFTYRTIYEDTNDPTVANPSCETPCPPVYLNFTLAP